MQVDSTLIKTLKTIPLTEDKDLLWSSVRAVTGPHINVRIGVTDGAIQCVMLTADRNRADFSKSFVRRCNGLVLGYPSWNLLSVPPEMCAPSYNLTHVTNTIDTYDVYDIRDGTTVTLYSHDGEWCMSTVNGIDVRNYRWTGGLTYAEALQEVATLYPEFSFDTLDTNKCYTVGFRHADFHPLKTDPPAMWFIQAYDLVNGRVLTGANLPDIGIPRQELVELPALHPAPLRTWLIDQSNNALADYVARWNIDDPRPPHYGYLLRSTNGKPDLMIESSALRFIRSTMYDFPKDDRSADITHENRRGYAVLRAFLSPATRKTFLSLFPQYVSTFEAFHKLFATLVRAVVDKMRSPGTTTLVDGLATVFASHIKRSMSLDANNADTPSIVADIIIRPSNVGILHKHLSSPITA
jgi:hypothetical protein